MGSRPSTPKTLPDSALQSREKERKELCDAASRGLCDAAKAGNVDGIRTAIEAGADVNSYLGQGDKKQDSGCSPLYLAMHPKYGDSEECVRVLLKAGALVDRCLLCNMCCYAATQSVVELAMEMCNKIQIARLLIEKSSDVNQHGGSPLRRACKFGKLKYVHLLLDAGADVNFLNEPSGESALMAAVLGGSLKIIRLLLKKGAHVNHVSSLNYAALHFAHSEKEMQLLLDQGADPRIQNRFGQTAFQFQGSKETSIHVYDTWTPFRMLPRWNVSAFPLYVDCCPGFKCAIQTTLLVLLRYRYYVPKNIVIQIVRYICESHRQEQWWPIQDFSMAAFM